MSSLISSSLKQRALAEEGLFIENLDQCMRKIHERELCPMRSKIIGGNELLSVTYNPSAVRGQDSVISYFPDNSIKV